MSIQTEIDRIQNNIANTYVALEALGCDMPEEQTSDNLFTTAGTSKVILYKEQELTEEQKSQARKNIDASGIYIGSGDMPEGYNVQIDIDGEILDVFTKEELSQLSETIADYSVVDYVKTEAKEVVDKIVAKRTINSLVLLMGADIHVSSGETVRTAIKHMGQGMNEICNYITPDGALFLGDYNYNVTGETKTHGIEYMKYFGLCIADVRKAILTILMNGNHDYYSCSTDDIENRLSEDEVYALIGSHNTDKVVVDVDNLGRNYGYVDFAKQRIRLIYLNTTDIAGVDYTSHLVSTIQGQWFVTKALDLSDKEDEENWGIIVCGHIPLFDNPQVPTVLGNFVDRGSGNNFGVSYDFTNTKANLIAVFHGHIHNFKVTTKTTSGGNTITYICIPNAVPNRENPYTTNEDYNEVDENGNSVSYPKTADTAEDTSFNVVIIDRDNSKIHAICYGAGYDREIDYTTGESSSSGNDGDSTEPIVNQLHVSVDTDGSIYNGKGFKEDTYLSSSNGSVSSKTGYVTTGFIPIGIGSSSNGSHYDSVGEQVIYMNNTEALPTDGYVRIAFFDASKNFIYYQTATSFKLDNDGYSDIRYELGDDGYISLLDVGNYTYMLKTNSSYGKDTAFFRLCAKGIDEETIITVNEPIN